MRQPVALIVDAVDHAFFPGTLRRLIEPALARRAEQRLTGNAGMDRQRIAGIVEDRAKPATRVRPVDAMLHVLFTRARELDRTPDRLRHLHRLQHVVRHDLAAEAAAEKGDIDLHVVDGAADRLRHRLLARGDRLDGPPDFDRTVAVARGGVDRLERRVRDVRQHEAPLDDRSGALLQDLVRLTPDSAVTARSASRPASSMASIPALERSPAPPPSNSTSSTSSARLACQK